MLCILILIKFIICTKCKKCLSHVYTIDALKVVLQTFVHDYNILADMEVYIADDLGNFLGESGFGGKIENKYVFEKFHK